MAADATRLLDGHVEHHDDVWLQRYCRLVV